MRMYVADYYSLCCKKCNIMLQNVAKRASNNAKNASNNFTSRYKILPPFISDWRHSRPGYQLDDLRVP